MCTSTFTCNILGRIVERGSPDPRPLVPFPSTGITEEIFVRLKLEWAVSVVDVLHPPELLPSVAGTVGLTSPAHGGVLPVLYGLGPLDGPAETVLTEEICSSLEEEPILIGMLLPTWMHSSAKT